MKLVNFSYFLYIKISGLLYRYIKWLSLRNPNYITLMNDLADHNKDVIMNSSYVKLFEYSILQYIPFKYLDVIVYTEGAQTDVIFLLRLYKTLIGVPEFLSLGSVKIVIICTHGEEVFTLARSFVITPKTTPQDFILHFFTGFVKLSIRGYSVDRFDVLFVKTISGDTPKHEPLIKFNQTQTQTQTRSYSTKSRDLKLTKEIVSGSEEDKVRDSRRFILPLIPKDKRMTKLAVFDIETFVFDGKLYPYAIGLQYAKYNKIRKIIFYYENLHNDIEKNSTAMLEKMVKYMVDNCKSYTIFAHNLGKFDGILMMSSIFKVLGPHSLIVGKDNRIISLSFKGIKMLDSLKIFPMSLRILAKQFGVETQKGEFDHRIVNKDTVFDVKPEVLKYLEGDISSLYECMVKASETIFNKYRINITDVYSASSLAMKHFRTSYLDDEGIPLLPKHLTDTISSAYFGGISQVYIPYGRDLHYYDVNSLYPWAMTQDMPYEYQGIVQNPKLEDVFGFVYASIFVPQTLTYKPLPVRMEDGSIATPSGHILGVYFSEELKYAESLGCTVNVHKGYQFSRKQLFNDYVDDIYAEKAVATGSDRVFVKLLLNGLYGFFARNDEQYIALFLPLETAIEQAQIYPAYNIVLMDDNETALLIRDTQASKDLCENTNHNYYEHMGVNDKNRIKSNRGIAAAITAYSRVKIHQYKDLCGDVYYSDTDSIVSGNKLAGEYINNELGFMKDEYPEHRISEAVFISPKLYGLKLGDGSEIIKAKGVPEGVLNFESLMDLRAGGIIKYDRRQLFKSLNHFSIFEKDLTCEVKLTIPHGKEAVYNDDGIIIAFKDVHISVLSAINLNSFKLSRMKSAISSKIKALINKYIIKVGSRGDLEE